MTKLRINQFTTGITHINGEVELYPGKFGFSLELLHTKRYGVPSGWFELTEEEQDELGDAIEHTLNKLTDLVNKKNKKLEEEMNE